MPNKEWRPIKVEAEVHARLDELRRDELAHKHQWAMDWIDTVSFSQAIGKLIKFYDEHKPKDDDKEVEP